MWQRAANYNHRITLCKTVTACRGGGRKREGTRKEGGEERNKLEEGHDKWMEGEGRKGVKWGSDKE